MTQALLTRVELTDELLRAAWERMRPGRAHWPADFGQAMQHPLVSRLVRIQAALAVSSTTAAHDQAPRPQGPRWRAAPRLAAAHQAIDGKRAAAADLDD